MNLLIQRNKYILPVLVLAAYPIFALLGLNIDQVDPSFALRPLVISLFVAIALYWSANFILKDSEKTSLALSLVLILFYSYGHIYNYLEAISIFGVQLGRHRYLVPLWGLLAGMGLWMIIKSKGIPGTVTQAVTAGALVLLVFPVFQIGDYFVSFYQVTRQNESSVLAEGVEVESLDALPDVYLIILDSYARQDVLQMQYEFDNQEFVQALRDLGFYVADCSLSNFDKTILSLASQLNLEYIQTLVGSQPRSDKEMYAPYIRNNAVRRQLEALGYQTIAFETGYVFTEVRDADLYLVSPETFQPTAVINPFEAMLLDTTAVFPLLDLTDNKDIRNYQYYPQYIRTHFILDKLAEIPTFSGKKFVFAHILPPHRPYILAADGSLETNTDFYSAWGNAVDEEHDRTGYSNQVTFLNGRLIPLLDQIITQSETPPVILLFSDHGVSPYRNANLAAYYLPGENTETLYPTITSVNSFRVVFNQYFGGRYELLPDTSYRSGSEETYQFKLYQNRMATCQP